MFNTPNSELLKVKKELAEYKRIEENRQLQKQNIVLIDNLEKSVKRLKYDNDILMKKFREAVILQTGIEVAKLLKVYNSPIPVYQTVYAPLDTGY